MQARARLLTAKGGKRPARLFPSLTKYGRVLDKGHIPTSIFQTPVGKKHRNKDSGVLLTFGILLGVGGMSSHGTNGLPFLPQTGKKKVKTF